MLQELPDSDTAIELAAKEVAGLAQPILGSSIGELSQLIADRVRFWRWRSAVGIMRRANEIREKDALAGRSVPLKFFLPFIEEASKESEEETEVSELWAQLLATADKSTTGFDLVCLDVLRSIGGAEALLLRQIAVAEHLFEIINDASGNAIGTVFELRLKKLLTEDEVARLGHGMQFHEALREIIEEQFGIPTVRLFGSITKFAQRNSFAILTLEKLGILEGSTYWKDGHSRRRQTIGIINWDLYRRIRMQRTGRLMEDDDERHFMHYIGEMLALSSFGAQFVQRCITGSKPQR